MGSHIQQLSSPEQYDPWRFVLEAELASSNLLETIIVVKKEEGSTNEDARVATQTI